MATDLERLVVSLEANANKFTREVERARKTADNALRGATGNSEVRAMVAQGVQAGIGQYDKGVVGRVTSKRARY